MSDVPIQYRDMLRAALKGEKIPQATIGEERPLKRRKKPGQRTLLSPVQRQRELKKKPLNSTSDEPQYVVHLTSDSEGEKDRRVKENIDVTRKEEEKQEKDDKTDGNEDYQSEDDEFIDSDEFEDVDLDGTFDTQENSVTTNFNEDENGEINITIRQHRNKRKSQRSGVVDSEERAFRKRLHIMHLFMMVGHGAIRNNWLSDSELLKELQKQVPNPLKREVREYYEHRGKSNVTAQSKTRRLLDLLRHLMEFWQKLWVIDWHAPVIYKKTWSEVESWRGKQQKMTFARFWRAMKEHIGSRDIAAQGFVALLRSLNLPARLVFSIQPPDFTNMKRCEVVTSNGDINVDDEKVKPKVRAVKSNERVGDRLLSALRGRRAYTNKAVKTAAEVDGEFGERYGSWPVFWAEVWDKDSKRYVTIDPMVKKIIEVVSWKSKLEPPMNCLRNNAWYVVGYDRVGGVRDITRRYCKELNAKVRKKRITREEKWEKWWGAVLRGACSKQRLRQNRVDKFEEVEFEELGLKEGMPLNVGDFKGHPIYVLESDLKYNEVLMPKISCGGLANKGKSKKAKDGFIPVYKRSNVQVVRSARGWFMRGRVLKVGERPMKVRTKKRGKVEGGDDEGDGDGDGDGDGGDDDDTRLYAESQTELYKPPAVVNGIIPKNAFKNIDIYERWMIPDGCVHIKNVYAERATKLMGVEYANAVVGFEFRGRRDVSAKIEGIVTLEEYADAIVLLCGGIAESEAEAEKMRAELLNLHAWSVLLTKLKISKRLRIDHGEIESEEDEIESGKSDEGDESEFESGGFVVGETTSSRTRSQTVFQDNVESIDDEDIVYDPSDENVYDNSSDDSRMDELDADFAEFSD
ncbi:hypothetical protein CANINC_004226 [Pichia inconspicua]|uniref:Rad4 beta-hairpin domain-containing protein n=1 Tax=Pichia inconspicua TaxID=52247 RepID=A0A4T0WWN0_9ASCO|nr:hypothetical protein CANINC_004226 [[Candida] inconspicua]